MSWSAKLRFPRLSLMVILGSAVCGAPLTALAAASRLELDDVRPTGTFAPDSALSKKASVPALSGGEFHIFTDATLATTGLIGSYVNQNLRWYTPQDDWRLTHSISGSRVDAEINFSDLSWGSRASVGLTGGTDADWDDFSAQWDGVVQVVSAGLSLATQSDDGSRMWIDLDQNASFANSGAEFVNNNWGNGQYETLGPASVPIAPGVYRIRIQYEEGSGGARMRLVSPPKPAVRVAYLVPADRVSQAMAVQNLRQQIQMAHDWYAEQMERYGFANVGFRFETESDGVTPRVHSVNVAASSDFLRADVWGNVIQAAFDAGVPVWSQSELWILVPEMHLQQSDGSIAGGVALGAGFGNGNDPGVAVIGSERLSFDPFLDLRNDQPYAGLVLPGIGPFALVQDASFPWFEGTTISSVQSSIAGALIHEMTHGLGMPHDGRNDDNFHGNVMGNGLRGYRGAIFPDLYSDDMLIGYGEALVLSVSRYFQNVSLSASSTNPTVSLLSNGTVSTVGGHLQVVFQAADADGLRGALLIRTGEIVGELDLAGSTSGTFAIATPFYTPGQAETYSVQVFDLMGNKTDISGSLTPAAGPNRAPMPFCWISQTQPIAGQVVTFDASRSSDPDNTLQSLMVEWDLDGDGIFEVGPSSNLVTTTSYASTGTHLVRVRVSDPNGNQSVSTPIAMRVRSGVVSAPESQVAGVVPVIASASPNPFHSSTEIRFRLPSAGKVRIELFDVRGRRLRVLFDTQHVAAGEHKVAWDGRDQLGRKVASGVYWYVVSQGPQEARGKIVRVQ